ncbi:methylaspartate mutase subunit E [Magnetococcus sp. PR-3]|uniref:methylaspartate mutase subunit E n=1 Tax=Magnetococcus sp. PR-3 TaxID=3120355 RepID=UPI002FCE507E
MQQQKPTLLLGGLSGDAHSVGLNILRQALSHHGYQVNYLGPQSALEDFFRWAPSAHVIMVSNMDGHAAHYLRLFPELRRQYGQHKATPLWYLGGNLTSGDEAGAEQHFMEMGFHRVFPKFVDIQKVLSLLEEDMHRLGTPRLGLNFQPQKSAQLHTVPSEEKLMDLQWLPKRKDVLQYWKTGQGARDWAENFGFLKQAPSFPALQQRVNQGQHSILIQPRSGVGNAQEQIDLFQAFANRGAHVLSYQVDSLTRNNDYLGVDELLKDAYLKTSSVLNGFPLINHGVPTLRRISQQVATPLQCRHSTRYPELLAEVSYAGGVTAFEGGPICYNIPYFKDYALQEAIHCWQYVDRLTGHYYEKAGIVLDREFFGTLTATLIPPSLAITTCILESILAAQQGVKCVSLGYAEQGNRIQDVAAIRTMAQLGRKMLDNLGYHDVQVNTVFHQYMAAFPLDPNKARELILQSAVTAGCSGATRMLIKTVAEAFKVPNKTDNLEAIRLAQAGLQMAQRVELDQHALHHEMSIIQQEVESIFDAIVLAGNGNLIEGIIKGFQRGLLDIPFAPSIHNQGNVLTARDVEGAVRFLDCGHLPFSKDLKAFHRERMNQRRRQEGIRHDKESYRLVEQDVLQVARGQYTQWPLKG